MVCRPPSQRRHGGIFDRQIAQVQRVPTVRSQRPEAIALAGRKAERILFHALTIGWNGSPGNPFRKAQIRIGSTVRTGRKPSRAWGSEDGAAG